MKKRFLFVLAVLSLTVFSGCAVKNIRHSNTFSDAVSSVTEELNKDISRSDKNEMNIILTSMVDVNNLNQSSNFGRLYSDSLLTNLTRLGFNVIDYRGVKLKAAKKEGEFYLSREDIKNIEGNYYILVGTYGIYNNELLVNVRMLNSETNAVVVASNNLIDDPAIVSLALKDSCKSLMCNKKKPEEFSIVLKKDDCKNAQRCECENPDTCLEKSPFMDEEK
jgi:TolB-like protein